MWEIKKKESDDVFEHMCYSILNKVDGIHIFPKLPVYNRLHYKCYKYNPRVKGATKAIIEKMKGIDAINILTSIVENHTDVELANDNVESTTCNENNNDTAQMEIVHTNKVTHIVESIFPPIPANAQLLPPSMPQQLPNILPATCRPFHSPMYVAGIPIGHEVQHILIDDNGPPKKRVRSGDKKKKATYL